MIYWFFGKPGSGKTYAAELFSAMTSLPVYDGDDFQTPADRKVVKAGKFTIARRRAQLARIVKKVNKNKQSAIVTHPLPDRASRRLLYKKSRGKDIFILVTTPKELHLKRLARRKHHHFTADLLPAWIKKHWQPPKKETCFVLRNGTSGTILKQQLTRIRKKTK